MKKLSDKEILGSNVFYVSRRDGLDWNFEESLFNEVKAYNLGGLIRKRIEKNGGFEKFTFFWETENPFSQWHLSNFKGTVYSIVNKELLPDEFSEELEFSSAEQFMMYNKALLFLDREYARSEIVLRGNRLKFSQNEELKYELLQTEGTTLVEASPYDTIWGVGLRENDERIKNRQTWQGLNLLGEILTEIRDDIIRKEERR